jgi:type I restriction enzyme, S subunit
MTPERARVGDVLQLKRREVEIDPIASYRLAGVYSFGRGLFHHEPTAGIDLGNYRFCRVDPGDLVLSNIGAWEGGIAFARPHDRGLIGNHRLMTYVARDDSVDTNWMRWFLISEPGMALIAGATPGTVMRNRTLAIDRFESLEIPLPPSDEQRRVARRLDTVEAAAAELRSRSTRADALNDALTVALALRPELDGGAKERAGWVHTPLGDVLIPSVRSVAVEPSSSYLIAGIYSFGRGLIDRGPIRGADTSYTSLTRLAAGDVVVSKLNGWEGAVAVVGKDFDGFHVSSEYPVFVPNRGRVLPEFFAGIARAPSFWDDLNASARGSMVRRRRINPVEFLSTKVWLPPVDAQAATARALATSAAVAYTRRATGERIDALVPAALNEAFAELS